MKARSCVKYASSLILVTPCHAVKTILVLLLFLCKHPFINRLQSVVSMYRFV